MSPDAPSLVIGDTDRPGTNKPGRSRVGPVHNKVAAPVLAVQIWVLIVLALAETNIVLTEALVAQVSVVIVGIIGWITPE